MVGRSRRGLKRHQSIRTSEHRRRRFPRIVEEQGHLCWYCGTHMTADDCNKEHLLAKALGGTDTHPPDNIKATHVECNMIAGHLLPEQKHLLRDVGHNESRSAMFDLARQLVRAQVRRAFAEGAPVIERRNSKFWNRMGLRSKPSWWTS